MVARILLILVALTALLVACSGDDEPEEPDGALDTRAEAQADLRERVEELERELGSDDPVEELADLDDQLAQLEDRLGGLDDRVVSVDEGLDAEATARETTVAELRGLVIELRESVQRLEVSVGALRGDLDDLEARHNLLRDEFDHHMESNH